MDHQTFDRLTRLFGMVGSRRSAWRALLGGALLGATTRSAAAKPCDQGKHPLRRRMLSRQVLCAGSLRGLLHQSNIICPTAGGPVCCVDEKGEP